MNNTTLNLNELNQIISDTLGDADEIQRVDDLADSDMLTNDTGLVVIVKGGKRFIVTVQEC